MGAGADYFDVLPKKADLATILATLKWDEHGRVTVVSQDAASGAVLGVAFANREALERTLATGLVHYYSRSRGKLWMKGEESGHVQKLKELWIDCDGDALVVKVEQVVGNCHRGFRSCFSYRLLKKKGRWVVEEQAERVFDPGAVYAKKTGRETGTAGKKPTTKRKRA